MARYYVGLDVHSKRSTFVIQDGRGRIVAQGEVPTSPQGLGGLVKEHELPARTPVALETGTTAFFVARVLAKLGLEPKVIDAHEVRLKAHRPNQKSDRRDARELCEGLRRGIYRTLVHVPPREIALLRETLSRRRHFVRVQTAEVNAAKRLLRSAGLGHLARTLTSEAAWDRLISALREQADLRGYVEQHYELWCSASEQLETLAAALSEQQTSFAPDLERLETIPGVGPITASTAIAAFSDVHRFPDAKHAASYIGLVPSTYQSGDREAHGRITKRGSAELRAMLCECAHQARRPNHPLNPYFTRICARRGYKMAVTAMAHRLCRIIFAMLRDGARFDAEKLGVEKGPFKQTRVRVYRIKPASSSKRALGACSAAPRTTRVGTTRGG